MKDKNGADVHVDDYVAVVLLGPDGSTDIHGQVLSIGTHIYAGGSAAKCVRLLWVGSNAHSSSRYISHEIRRLEVEELI